MGIKEQYPYYLGNEQPKSECKCLDCNLPELETLSYKPPKSSRATEEKNTCVIEPKTKGKNSEAAGQPLEQLEGLCKKTLSIVDACKLVVQSYEDHETDTMTTCITVVQACEQLNCLLGNIRKEAEDGMIEMGFKATEQPNTELLIVKTVQGLISAVNRELGKLDNMTPNLSHAKPLTIHKALEEIDLFEKTTLFELQKAFE